MHSANVDREYVLRLIGSLEKELAELEETDYEETTREERDLYGKINLLLDYIFEIEDECPFDCDHCRS